MRESATYEYFVTPEYKSSVATPGYRKGVISRINFFISGFQHCQSIFFWRALYALYKNNYCIKLYKALSKNILWQCWKPQSKVKKFVREMTPFPTGNWDGTFSNRALKWLLCNRALRWHLFIRKRRFELYYINVDKIYLISVSWNPKVDFNFTVNHKNIAHLPLKKKCNYVHYMGKYMYLSRDWLRSNEYSIARVAATARALAHLQRMLPRRSWTRGRSFAGISTEVQHGALATHLGLNVLANSSEPSYVSWLNKVEH